MTTSRWGNSILDSGFTMIPNILIDKQKELNISDDELLFIIKVMRHHENFKLHDNQIDDDVSSKTLQRRRNSLKKKGYLDITIYKYQLKDGTWRNDGILYDFSGLSVAMTQLEPKKNLQPSGQNEAIAIPKVTSQHNINYNTTRELDFFKTEFEKKYKTPYRITAQEKLLLHNSSPEFKQAIPYIFAYTNCYKEMNQLDENVIPRLSFFLKVKFRQDQLIKFAQENIFAEELEAEWERRRDLQK